MRIEPEHVAELCDLWTQLLPVTQPSPYQFRLWLSLHTPETVAYGIRETSRRFFRKAGEQPMSFDHCVRFASRIMNEETTHEQEKETCNAS